MIDGRLCAHVRIARLAAGTMITFFGVFASVIAAAQPVPAGRNVTIADGTLRGREMAGVAAFKGIPYALPPVAALRWRPPQAPQRWSGVRDAGAFGHDCMQRSNSTFAAGTAQPDEDCLYLNVYAPAARLALPAPVMVWIHGGGFIQGGSSALVYDGSQLARKGVVVVTINYRLGRFGFFAHPSLAREHPDEPAGNYAYLDQIAAMRWVRANIAAFGGDPANVTIFGQSAGAVSVKALLCSPLAQGLFQKAIIQSAPVVEDRLLTGNDAVHPSAEALGIAFALSEGIDDGAAAAARLRALPADELLALTKSQLGAKPDQSMVWGGPAIDGRIIPVGCLPPPSLPIIVGANSDDVPFPVSNDNDPLKRLGNDLAAAERVYDPEATHDPATIARKVSLDAVMLEPARHTAAAAAAAGSPAYQYRFGYITEGLRDIWVGGAPHGAELTYTFDNPAAYYGPAASRRDVGVADLVSAYWLNFARTGDPNGAGLPVWPRYSAAIDRVLEIQPDGSAVGKFDPLRARLDLAAAAADRNPQQPAMQAADREARKGW